VRWAAVESVTRYHGGSLFAASYLELAARRGRSKAKVAIARRVLTLAFYALRDGVDGADPIILATPETP
jgi:hypothetical protein